MHNSTFEIGESSGTAAPAPRRRLSRRAGFEIVPDFHPFSYTNESQPFFMQPHSHPSPSAENQFCDVDNSASGIGDSSGNPPLATRRRRSRRAGFEIAPDFHPFVATDTLQPSSNNAAAVRRPRRLTSASAIKLPSYVDLGDPEYICPFCYAIYWFAERNINESRKNAPIYKRCCKKGAVVFPSSNRPPSLLKQLLSDPNFQENIRAYNAMFSMTSFGAKIDESVNNGRGPYVFKISGQISHWIGCLCPDEGVRPRFLQLYLYDTENEISNRMDIFSTSGASSLNIDVVGNISRMLHMCNEYIRLFKTARDWSLTQDLDEYSVRLYTKIPASHNNLPASGTLGAIVTGDDCNALAFDVVVHSRQMHPSRVPRLHPAYMPLQYPLLFPFGEDGWSSFMRLKPNSTGDIKKLTVNAYYRYLLHNRVDIYSILLQSGRLLQQFLVDAYVCIEQDRLDYIRQHQDKFRMEYVSGVRDAISRGDSDAHTIGKRMILPSSFVGGPRYMYQHYQDALAICRVYGNPQYFITFTCNVKWPELRRYMLSHNVDRSQNRPDIVARIFQMKLTAFLNCLKKERPFGKVKAFLYTIEFQKRGLPHSHTLLWVSTEGDRNDPAEVDKYISAELPDPVAEPALYATITSCMFHGPCGLLNPLAPCTRNGICSKGYPKPLNNCTYFDKDGYVHYKRNSVSSFKTSSGIELNNGYIVPYNRKLSSKFDAHINVEYCGWNMLIKYLFKYISKGVDRVSFAITRSETTSPSDTTPSSAGVNEIKSFVDGRYICPHEASWRIFNFSIHERWPAVQILSVHLYNMQNAVFENNRFLEDVIRAPNFGKTTLMSWLSCNTREVEGRHLTYVEFPSLYRWDASSKEWLRRAHNAAPAIGRLAYVHPTSGELFYLRMLLCHQRGCGSYADIRTVRSHVHPTFRSACAALGLLGDDREWWAAFDDASKWATSIQLRQLFCHLLLFCEVTDPLYLWENGWRMMSNDISHQIRRNNLQFCSISDDLLQQYVLLELEKILSTCTPSRSLSDFHLPTPSITFLPNLGNRLLLEERNYDTLFLHQEHLRLSEQLNTEQYAISEKITNAYMTNTQLLLFVYGHGGTGKTFLWSTILAYFRSKGVVVLAVAASGIASLLLPSGRTAHSRFKIPLDLSDTSICHIKKKTHLSELLLQTKAIVWDEATMTNRKSFECVDRSLRDILDKPDLPFGGITMLLGGDFRQTLPVLPKRPISEVIDATLPNSFLWPLFTVCPLLYNMRIAQLDDLDPTLSARSHFASWLLDIGNGCAGVSSPEHAANVFNIEIPNKFLLPASSANLQALINFVYTSDVLHNPTLTNLCSRAIVCPKNETADEINSAIIRITPGVSRFYLSSDSITAHTQRICDSDLLYPPEYLNDLTFPGLPLHELNLKINCPIMLLRNLNQVSGLCNGTRLIVTRLLPSIIEATIATGACIGARVCIPRLKFIHNNPDLPFTFIRKQFPVKICYAMTINKSQGQSLAKVGIYLPQPVFSHGQLYVALSRATSPDGLKILILDKQNQPTNKTKNVVYTSLIKVVNNL